MSPQDLAFSLEQSTILRAIFNSRAHNIILIGADGRLQAFNEGAAQAARQVQGIDYKIGQDFFANIPEKYQAKIRERHAQVLAGKSLHLETSYRGVDGISHWYDLQYDPIRNENGKITGICLTNICIDERKRVEQTLKESEEKFRKFFEEAPMAMAMVSDFKFVKINRAFQEMLGYTEEEFMGKTLFEITHPDDLTQTRKIALSIHEGEKDRFQSEKRYIRKDGQSLWANVSGTVIRDASGNRLYSLIMVENISGRITAQQALQKSEADLRAVFNSGSQMMTLLNPQGYLLDCNHKAKTNLEVLTGMKMEKGRLFTDYMAFNREFKADYEIHFRQALQGEVIVQDRSIKSSDGSVHWMEFSYNPFFDSSGVIAGVCMTGIAIDERKRAEEALRKSEADLRSVFNSGTQLMILLSPEGLILDCNKTAETYIGRMTGRKVEKGKLFVEYMAHNLVFLSDFENHRAQALRGEIVAVERAIKSSDGSQFWLGVSYNPVYDAAGTITGVCMTAIAIDERKKMEEALRRSEADLKAVFNSGSHVMVLIGRDGKIHGFNKSASFMAPKVLGRGLEIGMLFADTLPPGASLEIYRKSFESALEGRETKAERSIQAADGRERWVEVNYQPVLNDQGRVEGVCFSLVFIDERKKAENDLRESEERYRKLIEFSPEAVVVHAEGRILYVNSSGLKMFGTNQPEKIIGKMILDFVHPEYRELSLSRVQKISHSGDQTEWTEQKLLRSDGRVMDAETKGTPFVYQGRPAVLTIVRDVTDRKKTQGMLLRYERLAAVGNVIAAIAHEIRNPLAVVSGMSQILKAKLESRSEFSQELATILGQTDRLRLFMNDILDYSRETEIKKEKVELRSLLDRSLVTAQTQFGPQHVNIQVKEEIEKGIPDLWADGERLEQVLSNLILNAFQSMKDEGSLTLSARVQDGWIFLGVKDNGPGINESDLPHLFEPFFTTKKNGSGLGLPISQKIAEAHRGKIEVHRIQPRGTLVTLQLPVQKI